MKKLLIMAKDVIEEKSFEEIYSEFQPLILKNIREWENSYEPDDIKGICEFYLWKAYDKYDINKCVGFGHYASVVVNHGLLDNLRRYQRYSGELSLNASIISSEIGEIAAIDMLKDEINYTDIANNNILISQIKSVLNKQENIVFDSYFLKDMKLYEVADMIHMHRSSVSKIMSNVKNKIRGIIE